MIAVFRIQYQGWTIDQAYEEMKRYGYRNILLFRWKSILDQMDGQLIPSAATGG